MAFLNIPNVKISGISACVPKEIDHNKKLPISKVEIDKLISAVGIEEKRISPQSICTSDLCYSAAEKLISDLKWDKKDIDCLVFVSQTPDYILPATSCILQDRLGLSEECLTKDISLGCSGWVYGLNTISSILSVSKGSVKKALLLVGDTSSKTSSRTDKSIWPLFGDAGTATAIEFDESSSDMHFHLASDGSGEKAIKINDGGFRNQFSEKSLQYNKDENGIEKNDLQLHLDGMDVFSFAISKAPESVKKLCEQYSLQTEEIDFFLFHQANLFLNERIRKKLKLPTEKVPYSLKHFGNTSSASIPLTYVVSNTGSTFKNRKNHIGCGFGVGLSWGSVYFETENLVCSPLIEI